MAKTRQQYPGRHTDRHVVGLMHAVDFMTEREIAERAGLSLALVNDLLDEGQEIYEREQAKVARARARSVAKTAPKVAPRRVVAAIERAEARAETKSILMNEARRLRADGVSDKKIAEQLGGVTHTTIRRWLAEPPTTEAEEP